MGRPAKTNTFDLAPRDLGRYRLHGEIASGGMATVHFGRQVGSGGFSKTVAIKRLHPQFGKMPEFVSMFLAEARLAARIRHPNVVQPLDVLNVDDELFLVMEYVEGDSLSRLMRATLARRERVPVSIAVSILCGVLHGLHAAHEAKSDQGEPLELVHRDVSPQNVLVGVDGVPRVIDFGIAKAADSVQFTRDGELKGKLSYMAPEQLSGRGCTRRTDLYAASVILWETLTSQRLFDADDQSAILTSILHKPIEAPSAVAEGLPKVLDDIVLKGLARDPSARFATAREMAIALEDSVPLATPSSVGSWVEVIAAKSLKQRGQRVAEIESVPSLSNPGESVEEIRTDMILSASSSQSPMAQTMLPNTRGLGNDLPTGRVPLAAPAASGLMAKAAPVPPPPESDATTGLLAGPATPRSPLVPVQASRGRTSSGGAPADGPRAGADAPQWPVPGIVPVGPTAGILFEPIPKRSSGGGMVALLLFLALAVVAIYFIGPEVLKRSIASSAARDYGVTLTIERVVLGLRQIRLIGVTATTAEVAGVTLRSKEVDVGLSKLTPSELTAFDVVVEADGPLADLVEAESRWSGAHEPQGQKSAGIQRVRVDSGQLTWTRPFGDGTRLVAENVTLDAERSEGQALGDDYVLSAPIVDLTDTSGKIGPWPIKITTTKRIARAIVGFDSAGASPAQAVVSVWDGTLSSIEVIVPKTPFSQLGIEPGVLGLQKAGSFFLEGDAEYTAKSAARVDGHIHLTATGVPVGGAVVAPPVDVELRFAGDPKAPIEWGDGAIAVGAARARPSGAVTVGPGFVHAELGWKSGGVRCPGGGDAVASTTLRIDSRTLDAASWAYAPARCGKLP